MRSAGVRSSMASGADVGADQRRSRQQGHILLRAQPRQRPDERLRLEDAGVRREQRGVCPHVRLAGANEAGVDDRQASDAVRLAARAQRFERWRPPRRCARRSACRSA